MSHALDDLLPGLYEELRELATTHMRSERAEHTLQPTALAHEVYLRLRDTTKVEWGTRGQFLAIAARAMRQILVDHARRRRAAKRGGGQTPVTLVDAPSGTEPSQLDLLDLDAALDGLAALDERKARVVEMRFFAGLSIREIAEATRRSNTSVEEDWYFARAWLRRRLRAAGR